MSSKRKATVVLIGLLMLVAVLPIVLAGCGGAGPSYNDTLTITYPTPGLIANGGISPPNGIVTPNVSGNTLETKMVIAMVDGGPNVTCNFSTVTGHWSYPQEITGLKAGRHYLDVVGISSPGNYTTSSVRVNFSFL